MIADTTKLEKASLRAQAARKVKAGIITGEIVSGQLYTIGEFAERFGVSATPVREALGDLAAEGLVEIVRNRGFIVPPVTEEDLDEIFQLRMMLEVPALAEVVGRLTAKQLATCRELVERGKQLAVADELAAFLETDRAFHLQLLEPFGNRRLLQIVDRLRDQARLYGLLALAASGRLVASAEEHEVLLNAIERGDAAGARAQMTRHLEHTRGAWAGRDESDAASASQ